MSCPRCAAANHATGASHCAFCGAALSATAAAISTTQALAARIQEQISSVSKHPEFPRWLAHEPSRARPVTSNALGTFFGLFFAASAAFLLFTGGTLVGPLAILPFAFACAGLWVALRSFRRTRRLSGAEIERLPAYVFDKQVRIHGASDEGPDQRTTYATLELASGARRQVRVPEKLAGLIALGDYGLAYALDDTLLEFRRVGSA